MRFSFLFFALYFSLAPSFADELRIAVASNFTRTLKAIAVKFEKTSGHRVKISSGSSGKQYAQIKNGAPFELFFAADTLRPELLEKQGIALNGSRFTYAQGKLVLWSPRAHVVDNEGRILERQDFNHLAIANPKLAPYGSAAKEVLDGKGLWNALRGKLVQGENIGQTFQFVRTGHAQLGFIALSQLIHSGRRIEGSRWEVPQKLYSPIDQQAVMLKNTRVATEFLGFVKSEEVRSMIRQSGYSTP